MKHLYLFSTFFLLIGLTSSSQAQIDKSYIGYWVLTDGFTNQEKCFKDQSFELRADGSASTYIGLNSKGCKLKQEDFKKWRVVSKERKIKKPSLKDIVLERKTETVTGLQIGGSMGFKAIIKKKKGSKLVVLAMVPEDDTTTEKILTFKRKKKKKNK